MIPEAGHDPLNLDNPVEYSQDMKDILALVGSETSDMNPILNRAYGNVANLYKNGAIEFDERLDAFTRMVNWLTPNDIARLSAQISRESLAISCQAGREARY